LRLKEYIGNDTFLLTYGDALTDVNINEVINFHKNQGKLITVTAVRPPARFGEMTLNESNKVESFLEKPQIGEGWINGGFFVIEPEFFNYLENDQTILEKTPLEKAARDGEFVAFKHNGFWQCMDTKRDKETLEKLLMKEIVPWH
jgi:glucose-1-phosphate cytidylyltransferase